MLHYGRHRLATKSLPVYCCHFMPFSIGLRFPLEWVKRKNQIEKYGKGALPKKNHLIKYEKKERNIAHIPCGHFNTNANINTNTHHIHYNNTVMVYKRWSAEAVFCVIFYHYKIEACFSHDMSSCLCFFCCCLVCCGFIVIFHRCSFACLFIVCLYEKCTRA